MDFTSAFSTIIPQSRIQDFLTNSSTSRRWNPWGVGQEKQPPHQHGEKKRKCLWILGKAEVHSPSPAHRRSSCGSGLQLQIPGCTPQKHFLLRSGGPPASLLPLEAEACWPWGLSPALFLQMCGVCSLPSSPAEAGVEPPD